jgi:hypothetical protein
MMAVPAAEITPAVAVKLPVVDPAATVTDPETGSNELLLESATTAPPLGAAAESVALQLVVCAVARLVGVHTRLVSVGVAAVRVTTALPDFVESATLVALTLTVWLLESGLGAV